ncbi:MAG: PilZ domain-containing protein [Armatimonadota bacterium]|nr:PilZ domain-containing protein [Armatimonadota bacterium]
MWLLRRRRGERRSLPRLQVAVPVRYATEEGQVGIGVLVDAHHHGAGLLVPRVRFDAERVWLQLLWFGDRVGMAGRVAYVRESAYGLRLGLALDPLHPDTAGLLSEFVLPSARPASPSRGNGPVRLPGLLVRWKPTAPPDRYLLPVLVQQGPVETWAITQAETAGGAVLVLQGLPVAAPVRLSVWGSPEVRWGEVIRAEILKQSPFVISRIEVRYAVGPAA